MYFLMFYVLPFFSVIVASKLNLRPTLDEYGRELTDFEMKMTDHCANCEVLPLIKPNEQEFMKLKYTNILGNVKQRVPKRPLYWDEKAVPEETDKIRYITNDIINNINDLTKTNIDDNVEENFNQYYDGNRIDRIKYDLNRFDNGKSNSIKYNPFNGHDILNRYDSKENNNEHILKRFKVKLNQFVKDRSENTQYNAIKFYDNQNNYAHNKFTPENVQYDIDGYESNEYDPLNLHNIKMKYNYNSSPLEDDKSKANRIQLILNRLKENQYENDLNKYYSKFADHNTYVNNQVNDDGSTFDTYNVINSPNNFVKDDYVNKIRSNNHNAQNKYDDYENTESVEEDTKTDHDSYKNGIDKHNPYSNYNNKNKKKSKYQKQNLNGNIVYNMDDDNDNRIVLNYDKQEDGFKFW